MIVIPAAGEGKRFRDAGYRRPKHELFLGGKAMVDRVVENARELEPHMEWFVATQEHVGKTKGAVDTILRVWNRIEIPADEPLVIANCDQLLKFDDPQLYGNGTIFTFRSAATAHSYVVTDAMERIKSIVEKPGKPPSDRAVSGVYWFARPGPFIEACQAVNRMFNGREQYVSAALDWMIEQGYTLYAEDAPTAILGTPEDFQRFEVALQCAA